MKATIQYVDIPHGKRVLAASDLHAHGSRLARLLRKAGFCEDDMLFLVGDCLERGRENLKTLRMVMELCRRLQDSPARVAQTPTRKRATTVRTTSP